jgi:hypothetical protein
MFSILATSVGAWVLYGVLKHDVVIVIANAVSFCCLSGILWFKLREKLDPLEQLGAEGFPAGCEPELPGVSKLPTVG